MVRPESWIKLAGESPVWVRVEQPSSRPRFNIERYWAKRGVKSLLGGSKYAGRSATKHESCSFVKFTMEKSSRSYHGEGSIKPIGVSDMANVWSFQSIKSGTLLLALLSDHL